jgi:hypothetical protein
MRRRLKEDRNQHYRELDCLCWHNPKAMAGFKEHHRHAAAGAVVNSAPINAVLDIAKIESCQLSRWNCRPGPNFGRSPPEQALGHGFGRPGESAAHTQAGPVYGSARPHRAHGSRRGMSATASCIPRQNMKVRRHRRSELRAPGQKAENRYRTNLLRPRNHVPHASVVGIKDWFTSEFGHNNLCEF